ncbi:GNAT family N-acetyltransferase [Pseudomonas fluorescens]|uniref:L-ornithine N(alpha)-acyltransferase n=1 Tax=Pseudomonas lactucae TaxID=2813360 RepID=A0A9X1C8Y2_9PSED|nr:GNAT family N-acyltransferase [Pseudomonas lactucae]OPA88358.1 GNAT family N-acetyltransferase [Pseudomonas fluorescens]MBN2979265.1 GNAT family N-acetyltransferase [Pseudomonas lactucae]MBN2989170.1 GNAT family N-acetyltransferase [Pseudomonas lactucae]OPB08097.1 GNAT family N-acetyltransferase [Pseudomonas fluorescens]OPB19132.1 GNAT family N-acetyltransferase [Pseudomonas fluorescens]
MQTLTQTREADSGLPPHIGKLSIGLVNTREQLREVQALRYKVFNETFQTPALANAQALNVDEFDSYCDHLMVRDTTTGRVVGTYRVMSPTAARHMGHHYSEKEFDLSRLDPLRAHTIEAGHACVHPDYRSGSVIMMLWSGLATYMQREGCNYLMGCASVSLADGGHHASAIYHSFTPEQFAPPEYRVTPYVPFAVHEVKAEKPASMPPLLKGYLRSGAWVCGEPARDTDFQTADFFMLLPLSNLDQRYARHYLK